MAQQRIGTLQWGTLRQTCPMQVYIAAHSQPFPNVCFVLGATERKTGVETGKEEGVGSEKAKEQYETEHKPTMGP